MILALLVPIVASIEFSGGSLDDLIDFYTKRIDKQIVIGVDADQCGSFTLVPDNKKSLSQLFSEAIKRELMDGTLPVFGLALMPPQYWTIGVSWSSEQDATLIASRAVKLKDNKYSLDTIGKGAYPVGNLKSVKFSKPLKMHWFFDLTTVKGITSYLSEEEFLKAIASATLGTLKSSDTEYEIGLDVKRFRKACALWAQNHAQRVLAKNDSYSEVLRWKLTSEAIRICSDSQIEAFMKTPTSSVYIKILPYGSCGALVKEYTRATFYPREGENGVRNPQYQLFEQVDPLKTPEVELRPRVPCGVFLRYRDGKGGVGF